jgi:AmmeMemoRadiSam system protein B/AmmeMemoRadiSam system protein A
MKKHSSESDRRKNLSSVMVLSLYLLGMLFVPGCKKAPDEAKKTTETPREKLAGRPEVVLRSSLAGSWYSNDAQELKKQIADFFENAQAKPKDDIIALILPHAGYAYSGQTAAWGLKTLGKEYKRIVIIGPSHRVHMEEMLSVPRVTHFETPLGQIPLDTEFIDKLLKYPPFQNVPYVHAHEHSVQIELPLLQYGQRDFRLVPIVAGTCSPKTIANAATILRSFIDSDTLVIASSDFVHFGPNYGFVPFSEDVPQKIKELDMGAYEYIAKLDGNGFLEYRQRTGATICGYVPIAILLSMMEKTSEAQLMKYATSGQLTGDFTNSVSYLSVTFSGIWSDDSSVEPQLNNPKLTENDKKQLLILARESILYALEHRQLPPESVLSVTINDAMRQPKAAFVTLKKDGQLRGCIGDIFPRLPLCKSVIINAINAALNDRRFLPLMPSECNMITIEISVLTPPEPVVSPEDIRIGTDGIVLRKDGHSAVFLPQVAPEQGWDLETTLAQLSKKARLPYDAWKKDAEFLVFQADVFGENEK